MKILQRLKTSSKWQLGAGTILYACLYDLVWEKLGMSEEAFLNVFYTLLGIMGVQAATDFGKEKVS